MTSIINASELPQGRHDTSGKRRGIKRGKKTQEKEDASGKTHGLREEKMPPERKENRASDIHHT